MTGITKSGTADRAMDKLVKSLPCVPEVRKSTEFFLIFYIFLKLIRSLHQGCVVSPPPKLLQKHDKHWERRIFGDAHNARF